jgi:DNA-binding transcriptional ArsR family regulator
MRSFKYIRNPVAFELLADDTRRRIIYLLRAKEMTVSQLAADLHLTTQAVYHQIDKLVEVGLVEVAREERHGHLIETYYRATAEVFEFHHGEAGSAEAAKHFQEAFQALSRVGLEVTADAGTAKEIAQLEHEIERIGLPAEFEERISQLDDVPFFTKMKLYDLARLALMTDKQFDKLIANQKALRELTASSITKRAEKAEARTK